MRKINGKDLLTFLDAGRGWESVAVSLSCILTVDVEAIEVLSPSSWQWRHYVNGRQGWTLDCSAYMTAEVEPLELVGKKVRVMFGTAADDHVAKAPGSRTADGVKRRYGMAIVTSVREAGEVRGKAKYDLTFLGCGELKHDAMPLPHGKTWYDYEMFNDNEIWNE